MIDINIGTVLLHLHGKVDSLFPVRCRKRNIGILNGINPVHRIQPTHFIPARFIKHAVDRHICISLCLRPFGICESIGIRILDNRRSATGKRRRNQRTTTDKRRRFNPLFHVFSSLFAKNANFGNPDPLLPFGKIHRDTDGRHI